ncbi:acyl carrier protein [Mesoterricola sediminis]|uniref:Acyl carrier protein n=1 Tax=Mesoterricola sediminis TaxID=2927980 RepID=A0AA48GQF6_9BACT|nr:acyl carrier protein [Mesoterricola sediminis]BDU75687.1 acyl carrier protein [Mesoterricola sediminis]
MLNPGNASTPVRTPEDILRWVRQTLHQQFRLDPRTVTPEANLFTDLGLDSIDEVELAQHMQEYTGRRLQPDEFRLMYTVQDVVDCVQAMMSA